MGENNKKGSTLYVVLGVATLVVAIIGATFAYFSASQTNNSITGTTAEAGGLKLEVVPITDNTTEEGGKILVKDLIPLNLIGDETYADSQFEKAMTIREAAEGVTAKKACQDDLGNNICAVYRVTVTNLSATSTIQVQGKLNLTSTATNMYWEVINATTTDVSVGEDGATAPRIATASEDEAFVKVAQGKDGFITYASTTDAETSLNEAKSVSLAGSAKETYYVLVWLEEIGKEQQDEDASSVDVAKSYTGTVTFDAVDAQGHKSGVTATFLS